MVPGPSTTKHQTHSFHHLTPGDTTHDEIIDNHLSSQPIIIKIIHHKTDKIQLTSNIKNRMTVALTHISNPLNHTAESVEDTPTWHPDNFTNGLASAPTYTNTRTTTGSKDSMVSSGIPTGTQHSEPDITRQSDPPPPPGRVYDT